MELSKIMSVSGMSGLYKMENQRENGLIVQPLEGGKSKFLSSRKHMFTPLENITIYTIDDSIPLAEVFERMKKKEEEVPPADPKGSKEELHEYMVQITPEYDPERVYASDIKKMIKWYHLLDEQGLVTIEEKKEEEKKDKSDEEE